MMCIKLTEPITLMILIILVFLAVFIYEKIYNKKIIYLFNQFSILGLKKGLLNGVFYNFNSLSNYI